LSYSITKGIGVGLISYTLMNSIIYLVGLVRYAIKKDEKPVWNVSLVTIIVSLLFIVYFFVPATAF
jgi:xanthine/uracil/vitamin C permease (AzgA family)